MFAITPYPARRYVVRAGAGSTNMAWEACQVVGIDASRDDVYYLVEVRNADGEFYLERADLIRKQI